MRSFLLLQKANPLNQDEEWKATCDGFVWGAFIGGAIWTLGHRLWYLSGIFLICSGVIVGLLMANIISPILFLEYYILLSCYIGLVAADCQTEKWMKLGYQPIAIEWASSRDKALLKFLRRSMIHHGC